ncbi:hypothetical protein GUITHDRAFT_164625 [Guillardia theta CCMP2712]|uniref:PAS domain-containing protein n=2 Tax=Guillardia theta TaxID=55529 RepID=L1IXC6_GUITC|nr:hypothetical protein GUITHDRAFT_164625 [Guillardia theta CCMP2712]EKX40539.1 hypothetical protein GUITHDRAFT_164625 [Guillardia theta CCMP2712]|mmetsp:Transcript_2216/g.6731  ORF Transcript_2216/g.6731 Transcript_2216/m.6731 type:complete len:258 (+) Transcript_2216:104-877(+)|eukprot:XP_005827519.1 hypothetical protein GUITHDRAFT_164625 [Guillardia theta CCMP2712]
MTALEPSSLPLPDQVPEEVDAWTAFGEVVADQVSADCNAFIIVDNSEDGFPIVFASPAMCKLMGTNNLVGRSLDVFCGELTDCDDLAQLRGALSGRDMKSCCLASYNIDGKMFWNHVVMQPGLAYELPFSYIASHDVSDIFDSVDENSSVSQHPEADRIHSAQVQNGHVAMSMVRMMVYGEDEQGQPEQEEVATAVEQRGSSPLVQMDFDELSADLLVTEAPVEELLPVQEPVLSTSPREKVDEVSSASSASVEASV